ncbi:MAG TPA: DUF2721 domain-containing protein [Thermotogota bacterium]|nr:DUF2721 domain-containing protein [Thermotogota bacterium]
MDFTLTTPALLFPAISLLLLAYTNRFTVLAGLLRELDGRYRQDPEEHIFLQIRNLQKRIGIIRSMQIYGVLSFLGCVLSMFLLFQGQVLVGEWVFSGALFLLLVSLGLSLLEAHISVKALNLQLQDLLDVKKTPQKKE